MSRHIARWDLDKTYLRTEFDTMRDLVRTALERPDEKRTNPGASTLLREMVRDGVEIHILSGSPEQMRSRLERKLRLDGIEWQSFTLKPNLRNMLRFRFRALRDQLGYKLPALLRSHAGEPLLPEGTPSPAAMPRETLVGDDAEADAFVYSLYADILSGRVDDAVLREVCMRGRLYEDVMESVLAYAAAVPKAPCVERILIHLERQTPPDEFRVYGARVVPFYNYLQAAFVIQEDGRLGAEGVLRVGAELIEQHSFDHDALARSYLELARRGHLRGLGVTALEKALDELRRTAPLPAWDELARLVDVLPKHSQTARASFVDDADNVPDYVAVVARHNKRHRAT